MPRVCKDLTLRRIEFTGPGSLAERSAAEDAPMGETSFVGYVGDADFHDGSVVAVEHQDSTARVHVRGGSGKVFLVHFGGVRAVRANQAEGMMLYALSELRGEPPMRRFAFVNWDDDSTACLEVDAETIVFREE